MEDVYTIKVKTKPDTRNLYPSERRYSASTVSGLAWVHIALAATSFLLTCLALVNPNSDENINNSTISDENFNDTIEFTNETLIGDAENRNSVILVIAPTLITIFGLATGLASILASVRWYVDRNITWLFIMSILSTLVSFVSFVLIAVWFITTSETDITDFYKDKVPFKDFIVVKHTDVITKNDSHMVISLKDSNVETSHTFTKRVLSINILIAAFLELLWSILSIKISYKGMKSNYREDNERRGNCISVVTKIKGNDTRKSPRNKLAPHKPDLIEHYPSKKIKRIFLAQDDNGFYLKNQNNKAKNTETSSEIYKERMMSFLNRCASLEGISNPELNTQEMNSPSVNSESVLKTIPEVTITEVQDANQKVEVKEKENTAIVSWGDTPEHTIYNQNTLNLEKIFNYKKEKPNVDKE